MTRVLVVDDEPQIRRLLTVTLQTRQYVVETVGTGEEALDVLASGAFDILLLDLGLPDMDGLEVCRQLREWSTIPILVISVRESERDKVAALDLGADDYVTKPFGIDELLARMRASLRRVSATAQPPVLQFGTLTIDLARRRVFRGDEDIRLTPTEYDLLSVLSLNVGRVMTHRQILREVRGPSYEEETPLLRVHMVALRQKLQVPVNGSGYIATEPGVGYRMLE